MKKYNFKKDKFTIIKEAITEETAYFINHYFMLKRNVARTLFKEKYIAPFEDMFGVWTDAQVPDTYSHYADIAMETLLALITPQMEKATGLKLYPNYSYARIYKKGDILERHKDRFSCEISTTLNLGGDPWPIYLDPDTKNGYLDANNQVYVQGNKPGIEINLEPGDMLIYKGADNEHWREEFKGETCAQVFLHYNTADNEQAKNNIYDGKPHLGLPFDFKDIGSQF